MANYGSYHGSLHVLHPTQKTSLMEIWENEGKQSLITWQVMEIYGRENEVITWLK